MRPLPAQPQGHRTSTLKHGEGTNRPLASIREGWGCAAARRGEEALQGVTPSPRPEPTSPTRPLLPLTALSRSPHLPRPKKALLRTPRRRTSPRPAEHPPPHYLELGFAGSASAAWNMVALSNSAPQLRANRAVGRAGCPALPDHWPAWLPIITSSLSNTAHPLEIPPVRPASQREGSLKRLASALILYGFHWLSCPSVS